MAETFHGMLESMLYSDELKFETRAHARSEAHFTGGYYTS